MTNPYHDDDLVYVDPKTRAVVGPVEFDAEGRPISKRYVTEDEEEDWRKFYPWGTYRSMKSAFRLEGKVVDARRGGGVLEEVLPMILGDSN